MCISKWMRSHSWGNSQSLMNFLTFQCQKWNCNYCTFQAKRTSGRVESSTQPTQTQVRPHLTAVPLLCCFYLAILYYLSHFILESGSANSKWVSVLITSTVDYILTGLSTSLQYTEWPYEQKLLFFFFFFVNLDFQTWWHVN